MRTEKGEANDHQIGLRLVWPRHSERQHRHRRQSRDLSKVLRARVRDTEGRITAEAHEYARQIIFTVHFHVDAGDMAALDKALTPIHDQLGAAFIAGRQSGNGGKEAA